MAGLHAIPSAKVNPLGETMGKEQKNRLYLFSFIRILLLDSYTCQFLIALQYEVFLVDCQYVNTCWR